MRVLGISPAHDSSVAVVEDGLVKYFCKEERLSSIKRDKQPFLSLEKAFEKFKSDFDFVVISSPSKNDNFNFILEQYIKKKTNAKIIRMCEHHHLSHASLAFYNSGFDKAICLVIDRNGSEFERLRESESIFVAEYPNKFYPKYKSYWMYKQGLVEDDLNNKVINEITKNYKDCEIVANNTMNITKVYESATTLIGQHPLENGKTMGLAAYGKDQAMTLFSEHYPVSHLFATKNEYNQPVYLREYFDKEVKEVPEDDYQLYADYAFQVQKQTQYEVFHLLSRYLTKFDIKKVCVTGGYGLNVVSNQNLIKQFPDIDFYFEPLADDSGNSIGAAMYVYRNETKDNNILPLKHTFFNNEEHNLDLSKNNFIEATEKDIANYLNQQKIVAVYNEKSESGPRALGNRSILFDARNKDAKKIVNKIKQREWYRPFACSVLKEYAKDYFDFSSNKNCLIKNSKFMTVSFDVLENKIEEIPGVVHKDNTCRIQTVDEDIDHMYKLLTEFNNLTNVPLVLNTSFNLAGRPLIETPDEAIDSFYNTEIDVLWFPKYNKILIKSDN